MIFLCTVAFVSLVCAEGEEPKRIEPRKDEEKPTNTYTFAPRLSEKANYSTKLPALAGCGKCLHCEKSNRIPSRRRFTADTLTLTMSKSYREVLRNVDTLRSALNVEQTRRAADEDRKRSYLLGICDHCVLTFSGFVAFSSAHSRIVSLSLPPLRVAFALSALLLRHSEPLGQRSRSAIRLHAAQKFSLLASGDSFHGHRVCESDLRASNRSLAAGEWSG